MNMLIVDDDALTLNTYAKLIEPASGMVYKAHNYTEALSYSDNSLKLAVIDLNLPDGNGTELGQIIKERHPGCVIVIMSADFPEQSLQAIKKHQFIKLDKSHELIKIIEFLKSLS